MKFKKLSLFDNEVDISKKTRVYRNNSLISKYYDRFSPEDLSYDTEDYEVNATVNKESFYCSNFFDDTLNKKSHLINKCGKTYGKQYFTDPLDRLFSQDDYDLDIGDDDE